MKREGNELPRISILGSRVNKEQAPTPPSQKVLAYNGGGGGANSTPYSPKSANISSMLGGSSGGAAGWEPEPVHSPA